MAGTIPVQNAARERPLAIWLFLCAGLVFIMVILGGATRLNQAGLSMVEWQPLMGILPPLSEPEWQETFTAYQNFPEYQKRNFGMTLGEFQGIFWLEYVHRLWGRLIGAAFFFPFLYFWFRGRINAQHLPRLLGVFSLGALQGWLGWYMVQSGLVDSPDVSPYRLAAHLTLALCIYALLFRIGLGFLHLPKGTLPRALFQTIARSLLGVVALTVIAGAFVAGTDAGLTYNTFPRMGAGLVPEDYWALEPAWRNFFENIPSVQFNHRLLGIFSLVSIGAVWLFSWRETLSKRACTALTLLCIMTVLQVGLGIATLLLVVPVPLGVAHQAGALLLLTLALWTDQEMRPA